VTAPATSPARADALSRAPAEHERLLALPPLAALVRLAAPTTLVMGVSAVSNAVYTYYVSRLGTDAIAAVSLVFPISLFALTAMAGGVGAGAASAVARALGGHRRTDAAAVSGQALALSVVIGVAFGGAMLVGAPALFRLFGAAGTVLDQATVFARVVFAGSAITFLGGMFDSVLRGEGNVRVPAVWSTTSLVLQMLVTPVFMFVWGWGLVGAALAMLACQAVATAARAVYVLGGRGVVRPAPAGWPLRLAPTREILRVGVPAALATSVSNLGLMVLTGVVARFGETELAAYGLGTRLDFLVMSFAYGVGAAVLTLVGLATGARQPERMRAYVVRGGMVVVALLAVVGAALAWRPGLWLGLFTDDPGIHAVGGAYFRAIGPSYPAIGVSMVVAFAFQGLGRATLPLAWMVVRVVAVLGGAVACTQWLGLDERAVFAVIAAGNVVSAAGMVGLFVWLDRRLRRERRT
jgi:putative MATE family efflux protein